MHYTEARSTFQQLVEDAHGALVKIPDEVLNALSLDVDIMPSSLCADLDVPAGANYAYGIKAWRARLRNEGF